MNMKIRGLKTKVILRKAIEPILPKEIVGLKKMGFVIPENKWLAEELKDYVTSWIKKDSVRESGLFNHGYIHRVLQDHLSYKTDNGRKLQALVSFFIWWEQFIDG